MFICLCNEKSKFIDMSMCVSCNDLECQFENFFFDLRRTSEHGPRIGRIDQIRNVFEHKHFLQCICD